MSSNKKRRNKQPKVIVIEAESKQDFEDVTVTYSALIRPVEGDPVPPEIDDDRPLNFRGEASVKRGIVKAALADWEILTQLTTDIAETMRPRMLQSGPFRCVNCHEPAEGFSDSHMSCYHLEPPFVHSFISSPICQKTQCKIRAKQMYELALGQFGSTMGYGCNNCGTVVEIKSEFRRMWEM